VLARLSPADRQAFLRAVTVLRSLVAELAGRVDQRRKRGEGQRAADRDPAHPDPGKLATPR
jgi:hypothetical protein